MGCWAVDLQRKIDNFQENAMEQIKTSILKECLEFLIKQIT